VRASNLNVALLACAERDNSPGHVQQGNPDCAGTARKKLQYPDLILKRDCVKLEEMTGIRTNEKTINSLVDRATNRGLRYPVALAAASGPGGEGELPVAALGGAGGAQAGVGGVVGPKHAATGGAGGGGRWPVAAVGGAGGAGGAPARRPGRIIVTNAQSASDADKKAIRAEQKKINKRNQRQRREQKDGGKHLMNEEQRDARKRRPVGGRC
jgi:hypothetical protein